MRISKEIINQQSKEFNVSEIDAEMFIKSVTLSLKNVLDKCKIDFDSLDEETKMSFFQVALEDSTEKMNEFVNQYNSYQHKRQALCEHVLNTL